MPGRAGEIAEQAHGEGGLLEFIQLIIPDTLFSALTSGNVLQALFLSLVTGFAIQALPRAPPTRLCVPSRCCRKWCSRSW